MLIRGCRILKERDLSIQLIIEEKTLSSCIGRSHFPACLSWLCAIPGFDSAGGCARFFFAQGTFLSSPASSMPPVTGTGSPMSLSRPCRVALLWSHRMCAPSRR